MNKINARCSRAFYFAGAAMTILGMLHGCGSLNKPYPSKETFGLTTSELPPAASRHEALLRVERVRIAPPYDTRMFVYRLSETQYQTDYYNAFVDDPERLLTAELVRRLSQAGLFAAVLEPTANIETPLRMETSVMDYYADFRDKASPRAVVRARVLLVLDRVDATAVQAEWLVEKSAPIRGTHASDIADAWGRAVSEMITEIASRLADAPVR